jgi:hypothetical protein
MESAGEFSATGVVLESMRRLLAQQETREQALDAIAAAVDGADDAVQLRMQVLVTINLRELRESVDRLQSQEFQFLDIVDDSPDAHRKVADFQRILNCLGYDIGPCGIDGYDGGPPGKPVTLTLEETASLAAKAVPGARLLESSSDGLVESWTRDATRRLQLFLGQAGLPAEDRELRAECLVRPDGLFGRRTLDGVTAFIALVVDSSASTMGD